MKLFLIVFFLIPLFTIPAFGQKVGFYHNEVYEFSFNAPTDWQYQENVQTPNSGIILVMIHPEGLDPFVDIDTPLIGVSFENLTKAEVPDLNEQALENYVLEQIRIDLPNAKLVSSDVESTSWGWIVTTEFRAIKMGQQYLQENLSFIFKDRETYDVAYIAIEDGYYDRYYPVFEMVKESLVIKGVIVPEFHEIAIMVLGSGIIGIIAISKKFEILKILNS